VAYGGGREREIEHKRDLSPSPDARILGGELARAIWNGEVVADSDDIVHVEGNAYFPASSVNPQVLESSEHHSICWWKGRASYFHLVVNGERNENAAWFYPAPFPMARKIKGRIAFWHGVAVEDG
jgi:uncharacterized protein (DUF427 family)